MNIVLGFTVCNRTETGNKNLIHNTILSLEKSGLWNSKIHFKIVLSDSNSKRISYLLPFAKNKDIAITKMKHKTNKKGAKANHNMMHLFDYVLKKYEFDYFLYLEDDIIFCKNFIENVKKWLDIYNNKLIASFYTPFKIIEELYNKGIYAWEEYPREKFYGTQCNCFTKTSLHSLYYFLKGNLKGGLQDFHLRKWMEHLGIENMSASCPSLVQHITDNSVLQTPSHTSFFLGEDTDPSDVAPDWPISV